MSSRLESAEDRKRRFAREFGRRLKSRIGRDVNIEQLAAAVEVSAATIYEWIAGRSAPSLMNAEALARALGKSVQWLATGQDVNITAQDVLETAEEAALEKRLLEEISAKLDRLMQRVERLERALHKQPRKSRKRGRHQPDPKPDKEPTS
jgi:transcriptional regulator with XRE-family HTH domain